MEIPNSFYFDRWEKSNIPISMRGMDFRSYVPASVKGQTHSSGQLALEASKSFVDNFTNHFISPKAAARGELPEDRSTIGKGLMFYGPNGTRKSTLAATILTEVQYLSPSYYVYYIRFSEWQRALQDTFVKEPTERSVIAKNILALTEKSHLVVLDDIGQEYRTQSEFTERKLHELLRMRYELARPTITTTNIDPDLMRGTYGESFDSFRRDAFDVHSIFGEDTRIKKDN